MENGIGWTDIAVLEDYASRAKQKYPSQTIDWAKDMAFKRLTMEKERLRIKSIQKAKQEAKMEQDKLNGVGSDYQQGVWAPFNGKIYHDRAKMVADAKALGLEETGGSTDYDYMKNRAAEVKKQKRVEAKQERIETIRQTLAHLRQKS